MVGSAVYQPQHLTQGSVGVPRAEAAVLDSLIDLGVDDLAKYRIMEFFHDNPLIVWDAETCASQLGLHSVERTATLLEQLSKVGLLSPVRWGELSVTHYQLAADEKPARRLAQLFHNARVAPYGGWLFRALASRSLARARELSRASKGQPRSGNPSLRRLLPASV